MRGLFFNALIRLDGAIAIAAVQASIAFAIDTDADQAFLQWLGTETLFSVSAWYWVLLIGAGLVFAFRPGFSVLGTILIAPTLLFFYYLFRYMFMLYAEGSLTSPLLVVIVFWAFAMMLLFYVRSRVIDLLFASVVDLKRENTLLKAENARLGLASTKPTEEPNDAKPADA